MAIIKKVGDIGGVTSSNPNRILLPTSIIGDSSTMTHNAINRIPDSCTIHQQKMLKISKLRCGRCNDVSMEFLKDL